jgi:hypothetical protein
MNHATQHIDSAQLPTYAAFAGQKVQKYAKQHA